MQKVMFLFVISLFSIGSSFSEDTLKFEDLDEDQNLILDERELEKLFIILKPNVIKKFQLIEKDFKYSKTLFLYQALNIDVDLQKDEKEFLKYLTFDACFNLTHCKESYLDQIKIDQLSFKHTLSVFTN